MLQGLSRSVARRWLVLPLVPAALLVILVALRLAGPNTATAEEPLSGRINAVYLVAPGQPGLDPALARARGIRVVATAPELVSGAATADMIVVDNAVLGRVDQDWLADQLHQGKWIVGLNVLIGRLQQLPGYRFYPENRPGGPDREREAAFRMPQDFGGRSFFSYAYQFNGAGGYESAQGTDSFGTAAELLERLYTLTPAGQAEVREMAPAAPTPAPVTGPLPTRQR